MYGSQDIAVNYVLDLIDRGSAKLLEKDRAIRSSTGETTNVMRRQAEQAGRDSQLITTAADRQARAYERTGLSSSTSATRQREASHVGVSAMEQTARAAEEMERRTSRSWREAAAHARQAHGPLRDIARAGAALGGTYLGYSAAKSAVTDTLELGKATKRLHDQEGLSYRTGSALLAVTQARGIATTKLETSLGILATRTDQVTKGNAKQAQSLAALDSVAHTFTGRQRELANVALHATRGSDQQVRALTSLRKSLTDEAAAHTLARAGRVSATLSQAQQYTMTKQQIAAWHDEQAAIAAHDRVATASTTLQAKNATAAVTGALAQATATNKQADAFKRLGLSQADIARGSRDMDFLLRRVGQGLAALPGGTDRTAIGRQLFGRGASQLMPIVGDYEQQIRLAQQYGATLDGHTIKSLDQLEEAQRRVHLTNTALKLSFTQAVEPALLQAADATSHLTRMWTGSGSFEDKIRGTDKEIAKLDIGGHIASAIKVGLPLALRAAAHAGPLVAGAFFSAFAHAGPAGDAVFLAWGAKKLGLWSVLGKTAGKAFFAKFLETNVGTSIASRFGLGGNSTGGVLGKATGVLGASPETPLWVRSVGPGIPGGGSTLVGDAEKVGGGAGAASVAARVAAHAVPIVGSALAGIEVGNLAAKASGMDSAGGTMRQSSANFGLQRSASGLAQVWGFLNRAGTDDPDKRLNEFGDRIHKLGANIDALPAGKLRALAKEARDLFTTGAGSDRENKALSDFRQHVLDIADGLQKVDPALKVTGGNFDGLVRHLVDAKTNTSTAIHDIRLQVGAGMDYIKAHTTAGSVGAEEAISGNFRQAAAAVKAAMDAGIISTKKGMAEIQADLTKSLMAYGVSKNAATYGSGPGHHAEGGYVGAAGRRGTDRVPIVVGEGESVSTIHQQREINQGLAIARAATGGRYRWGHLNDIYSNVTTRHSDAASGYAQGGIVSQVSLAGVHPGVLAAARTIEQHFPGLTITSGTGGGHAAGSYHYRGEAVDIAGGSALMNRAASWIGANMARNLAEGIHNPNLSIKNGQRVPASFWGPAVWAEHANHIHVAVAGALGKLAGIRGGGASSTTGSSHPFHPLPHVHTNMTGALGAIVQAALNIDRNAADSVLRQAASGGGGGNYTGPLDRDFGRGSHVQLSPRQVQMLARRAGLPSWFWKIAHGESNYEPGAYSNDPNGFSHGRGLYQITPEVQDPATNRTLLRFGSYYNPWDNTRMAKWMYDHAASKTPRTKGFPWYGTKYLAQGGYAWGGWNAAGGDYTVDRPTLFGAGERGRERVVIQPEPHVISHHTQPGSFTPLGGRVDAAVWSHARKLISELEKLGNNSDAQRRAKTILSDLPAVLARQTFDHLVATGRELKHVTAARTRTGAALKRAQAHVKSLQDAVTHDRHAGASQATIDAAGKAVKAAQDQVKQLSGNDKALTARQQRLTSALKLVQAAEGKMIDGAARRAQTIADQATRVGTRTDQKIRRLGLDPGSSRALGLQLGDSATELHDLNRSRRILRTQIARARRTGDTTRLHSLQGQLATVNDSIAETRTTKIERQRQKQLARAQETVDQVGFLAGYAQSGLTAYDILHRNDETTAVGMRGKAAAITGTLPVYTAQIAAYNQQAQVAKAAGDLNTYRTAVQAAADATNSMAQAAADAADLITQAARQQAQDAVDTGQFHSDLANTGLQGLQISQQLLGTSGTAGAGQQLADYIKQNIIPAQVEQLNALQDKLTELQNEPSADAQLIRQTQLDIANQQNAIAQSQLDELTDIKQNTDNLKDFGGQSSFDYRGQAELDAGVGVGA